MDVKLRTRIVDGINVYELYGEYNNKISFCRVSSAIHFAEKYNINITNITDFIQY